MAKPDVTFELVNRKEVMRYLDRIKPRVMKAARAGFMSGLELVKNDAKSRAPYKTGTLKRNIDYEITDYPDRSFSGAVGTDLEYAPGIEYGRDPFWLDKPVKIEGVGWRWVKQHPGNKPQPFLRPAVYNNIEAVAQEVQAVINLTLK